MMLHKTALGLLLCLCANTACADDSLAMRSQLEQKLRIAQKNGDCKAMQALFYSEGVDKARRKVFVKTVEDYLCANFGRPIASISFQNVDPAKQKSPLEFAGHPSAYTLEPMGAVVIDYGNKGKTSDAKALSFFYGLHDGQAWLITTKNAEVN